MFGIRAEFGRHAQASSGSNVPVPVISTGTISSSMIPISWNAVADALDYSVYVRQVGSGTWDIVVEGTTSTSQSIADLNPLTAYEYYVTARVAVVSSSAISSATTTDAPSRVIKTSHILMADAQNGLFEDREPAESGWDLIPTVSGAGRTLCENFNRMSVSAPASQHTVYFVRFLLGNISTSPISGGKSIIAYSTGWDGSWEPIVSSVKQNTITGNIRTGWRHLTIGGDPTLPIPAAPALASGKGIALVWTDWVPVPNGQNLGANSWDFYTRFLLPPRNVAPYALTIGNWDSYTGNRLATIAGRSEVRRLWRANENSPNAFHVRAEGDYVTDPSTAGNIGILTGAAGDQCPSNTNPSKYWFGPPGPAHSAYLAVQYSTNPNEV